MPFKKLFTILAVGGVAAGLYAGSTGTTQLQTVTGSGGGTAFGDYVSDATALNTAYRYFIEVPPGLPQLNIDIFDPDIGLGGAAEATAGRDRARNGFDTTARYTLYGPDGVARTTLFNTGNTTTPAASDNTWTAFFSSTGDTVRDNFTTAAYTNNDGTLSWSTNWIETNDDNLATSGNITITGGQLSIRDNGDANPSTIQREANLTGWPSATLTFNYSTQNVEATDQMRVQVSNNGGGTWTTLQTFTGAFGASTATYDISAYIAANTRIRFLEVTGYAGTDTFLVDNLQIKETGITSGHWEVRVDQSNAVTTGDDINAFGLRANDGDATSAGTELPIYADSFIAVGVNPPASGTAARAYTVYPYITSGCTCSHNDFDFDSNNGTVGSMVYTSRSGAFSQTVASASLSADNVWNRDTVTGWTSDTNSLDYGIWTLAATIDSYLVAGTPNGNYANVYDSSYAAAANPPTANPQANAVRLYFPTDAGAAPAKPYLEQMLTQRFFGTLQVGSPARYTVTVRMTNPASQAITFSATRLITANVPGSGAIYGGNAQTSQGTIVSTPAVNGTGNITWNPGTVAAGATAILSYDVVVTATSAGQRIPVTGTPASGNGTRATYLDETGNASQSRAIFTFGPICEVAATQGLLTEVLVASFEASVRGNATLVTWKTASEASTIGFNLYRVDRATHALTRVNRSILMANAGAPQGGRYQFVDSGNRDPQPSYVLEELTVRGRKLQYGPFASATANASEPLPATEFQREPRKSARKTAPATHAKKTKPDAVMVGVRRGGLTRVTAADVAATLAMPQPAIEAAIRSGGIALTFRGAPVAWTSDNASLLFYAEAPDSVFSNERVYRLSLDKGATMRTVSVAPAPSQQTSFRATQQAETDAFAATVLPLDPDGDFWFWDYIVSGDAYDGHKSFDIDVPAVASSEGATLEVRLQGAITAAHRAHVSVNGTQIGDVSWNALGATATELNIPTGVLRDGTNSVAIEGVLEGDASFDVFYIDGFAVRYTRAARAIGGTLEMTATPGTSVTATALGSGAIALDITDPRQPALLRGGGTSFVVPPAATTLFFADPAAINAPSSFRGSASASLADRKNRADYVVIANNAVRSGADALAQLRSRDGLVTLVADLDDIYDEFSGGNATPYAIRDFLAATRNWSKAPRYVVLAGIGTLDYRGLTVDPGLVPPLLTKTENGLFAADARFADFDGDGFPELAIGRIPVSTNDELLAYVAKLDASAHASAGSIIFSADHPDSAADFKRSSTLVEAALDGRPASRIYAGDLGPAARDNLLAAWQNGSPLVSWIGHGGVDRISDLSLLTADDAASLTSTSGQLPLFLAMTCTINRFELGDVEALGSALTRAPNAGALAVWSSSGLSMYSDATQLERTFMQLAAKNSGARIGDLIVQSLAANKSIGETGAVYLLLGDPAIPLSLPAITSSVTPPSKGIE